jgi:hypothetical protein
MGFEPIPYISMALMAKLLNVSQRKLGTIIIQTVRILQHDSTMVTAHERFLHDQLKLLPTNLARQK